MHRVFRLLPLLVAITCSAGAAPLGPQVLKVGPHEKYKMPSQAANSAYAGDTVEIAAGTYHDCAIWQSPRVTIVGKGDVILADAICQFKAIFVTRGDDITIRGLTFTGAKNFTRNGAGIRAEGRNLTVESSKFIGNEEGILSAPRPESTIIIRDSYFAQNGICENDCAHGVYVGPSKELKIERSEFFNQKIGHHVKSRATRTELIGNIIHDGPAGTASYLVDIPNGGTLIMRDNTLEKGPHSDNGIAAVRLGEEGNSNVTQQILIENNRFTNHRPGDTAFVRNQTATMAMLHGNTFSGRITPLVGPGAVEPALAPP